MKTLLKFLLALLIVGGSVFAAKLLIASAKKAEQEPSSAPPPLVETVEARSETLPARVRATGTVIPARQVVLSPQVSGKVIEQSLHLVVGGRFAAGEVIVRIDPRDYGLAIRERRSQVEKAKLELELEKGRAKVAAREWEMLGKDQPTADQGALALRTPHLAAAEVALAAAEGALERAKLDRGRTTIVAPFNATVTAESVEIGQVVQPGSPLVTLVGTDRVWARVSLPMEQLELVRVTGAEGSAGSPVSLVQDLGTQQRSAHAGRVDRLVGELDPQTRLAQLIVVVDHPFDPPTGQLPLLPGAFVTAEIEGRELKEVIAVPRAAIIEGDGVWIVDANDELAKRKIGVLWGDAERVWVNAGLTAGDRIVTSKVPAIEGMKVSIDDSSGTTATIDEASPKR